MRYVSLIFLAACGIPNTEFVATQDGPPPTDGTTGTPGIHVDPPSIDVNEGDSQTLNVYLDTQPADQVEVDIATDLAVGLSTTKLVFTHDNFGAAQPVLVTTTHDDDIDTAVGNVTFTADTLPTVNVGTTIHDLDALHIVTDVPATPGYVVVTEGATAVVHAHLSNRPTGDITLTATMGTNPLMSVSPPSVSITPDHFGDDVDFTITATHDDNVMPDLGTLTFSLTGVAGSDVAYDVHDTDVDSLNMIVSPTSVGGTGTFQENDTISLNIRLTQRPAADVTIQASDAHGLLQFQGASSVSFSATSATDYMTNKTITVKAIHDTNTTVDTDQISLATPAITDPFVVGFSIQDIDVQGIVTDNTGTIQIAENAMSQFGVTLRYAPGAGGYNVIISSSATGTVTAAALGGGNTLTFTDANYDDASQHQVVVTGVHDTNLVVDNAAIQLAHGTTSAPDVPIRVTDIDTQAFVLSQTTELDIPEGGQKTFTVRLAYLPTGTATTSVVSSIPAAVGVTPAAAFDFTAANWNTPKTYTLTAPIDSNNVSEQPTISVSALGIPDGTLPTKVLDVTQINPYGWPAPPAFTGSPFSQFQGQLYAFMVTVPTSSLDSFGVNIPTASGDFRMALYSDNGSGEPVTLVAETPTRTATNGVNVVDISDVALPGGSYWIVLRVGSTTVLSAGGATEHGTRCRANSDITSLAANWPMTYAAGTWTCTSNVALFNFWITTYHQ